MNATSPSAAPRRLSARALHALGEFLRLEAAGGILLILAAVFALLCANSPLEHWYDGFRELPVAVVVGELRIAKPALLWINDGLMAVFFLLVALEIKREALTGQLVGRQQLLLQVGIRQSGGRDLDVGVSLLELFDECLVGVLIRHAVVSEERETVMNARGPWIDSAG